MIDTGIEDREALRGDNRVGARRSALERLAQVSWLRSVLLALAIGLVLKNKPFLAPDTLFILLFLVSVTYGLAIEFLKRFLPFIGLLISYDALRGIANIVNRRVHYTPMISFDLFIARGRLPTEVLQRVFYHGKPGIFEFFLYWLYVIHFVVPVLVAVLIWGKRPDAYWQYVSAFLLLSYSAFVTFLLFPAAPPFSNEGLDRGPRRFAIVHGEAPMRKLSLVAVGLSALIGLVAAPGLGSAPVNAAVPSGKSDGVATVRHRLYLRDDFRVTLRKLEARDMHTGKVRPLTDPPLTHTRTEGTNRMIKQIERTGCGYRNQAHYQRRIVLPIAARSAA